MSLSAADLSAALLRERAARYAAEAALFARDQALSVASHDLRSPLNAMHSWAYVLERQLPPGDVSLQRALGGIRTGIEQQTRLIETALDAPRADTRALVVVPAGFALAPFLDDCAALARAALGDARGTMLVLEAGSARDTSLFADAERLSQALWALTVFAIEASAPGATVTLRCDALASADSVTFEAAFTADPAAIVDPALPHALDAGARREALLERDGRRPPWAIALCHRVALAHGGSFTPPVLETGAPARCALTLPRKATT
ncbi:sensor histidine kinase [Burkholderia sp. 22PA0106]|uniref:sensor histidine kinase n=1 Tax=Burkholderia sp. 22PA0106 TaxID=3237371 RepID=UPI0039C2E789